MATEPDPIKALAQIARLVQEAFERRARQHDLSPTLARLLGVLNGRTPTMNELAELLVLDKSSTSGLVDRAQRRGLVRRVPSQLDRRAVRVRLSGNGRELAQQLRDLSGKDIAALLEPLAPMHSEALTEALSRILAAQTPR
jgi:MarR family transcriptional regulator, lower aerobic nicotinate degradation pathway regulator